MLLHMPPPKHYGTDFRPHFSESITEAFRGLLSAKHLYQSVEVDDEFITGVAKAKVTKQPAMLGMSGSGSPPTAKDYETDGRQLLLRRWITRVPDEHVPPPPITRQVDYIEFVLPTINTGCPRCGRQPCNPKDHVDQNARMVGTQQWFFLSYECQNCKSEPMRFLVVRTGLKLTLCGRSPMEAVAVPAQIPKSAATHFRDALLAYQSGQTLPGIFMLRVCIEQYWRGLPVVKAAVSGKSRPTGEELGAAYKATLPDDFKQRFPTLAETYDDLSAAMHTADANVETFEKATARIVEHFDAKRLFRLTDAAEEKL